MTELEKFNLFIEERIDLTTSNESISAYNICRHYVNTHFAPKSEQLKQQAAEEDNDLVAMGIRNQALREKRAETWEDWKEKILLSRDILEYKEHPEMGKVTISTSNFGILDYYPKANKILRRKINQWQSPGLRWLIKNFYLP